MFYRKLGTTGCLVGEVGFGGWSLGGDRGSTPEDDVAVAVVRAALARGANVIDTADVYGGGRSESLIGKAIKGKREHAFLATKGGLVQSGGGLVRDFSADHLVRAAEESRTRLGCDYIDLYQLHHPTLDDLRSAETWQALERLQSDGVIRRVGVAAADPEVAAAAVEDPRVAVLQIVLNVLDTSMLPLVNRARAAGVGVVVRAPLFGGLLAGAYEETHEFPAHDPRSAWSPDRRQQAMRFVDLFRTANAEAERSPAQAAISWVLAHEGVSVTIPGAYTPAQVEENLAASDLPPLSERLLALIQHRQLTGAAVLAE
jgi:aryl-alcohol dehydrogenase-like predicted oxidoreductase